MSRPKRNPSFITFYSLFYLTLQYFCESTFAYVVPDVTIEALSPQEIRVSIPDQPGVQFFAFHGNQNKPIKKNQLGDITGEAFRAKDGKWTIKNDQVNLQDGDVIHYWVHVQTSESLHTKDNLRWNYASTPVGTTSRDEDKTSTSNPSREVLVFEDNFNVLNTTQWTREIKIPMDPDYEFCLYHNENHEALVQFENGNMRLQPLILEDLYGENATTFGRLQLNGCTSDIEAECGRRAASFNILPPVISAQLTTKNSFSFRYGKIEIRAKFPQGDWLYPEMWLQPKSSVYGRGYASGRVLLGLARGNEKLINTVDASIHDGRKLDFGLRVATPAGIQEHIVTRLLSSGPSYTHDFHVYTTIWNEDGFQFLVDDVEVGRLTPSAKSWLDHNPFTSLRKSAPFDQEFYITLGIGVGGVRVFPDGLTSSGFYKPWKNTEAKAMLKFWNARNQWLPTWRPNRGSDTAFQIDYVRVWSFQ